MKKIHRFYYPHKHTENITITQEDFLKQLIGVLRIQSGEHIRLFDETSENEYEIVIASKKMVTATFVQHHPITLAQKHVTVGVAITKKDTFELIAQKAVEIGITALVPIVSERTVKKDITIPRLKKIIIEATEQSGRNDILTLVPIMKLSDFLIQYPKCIFFDTTEEPLSSIPTEVTSALIGPEGGWSDQERKLFKQKNIIHYSLGNTILRTETAAIVAMHRLLWN